MIENTASGDNGTTTPVQIRMIRPSEQLAGFVDAYYIVDTSETVSDRYLAGPGNIRFGRGIWVMTDNGVVVPTPQRSALFGPTDRAAVFGSRGAGVMMGAGLTPLGWVQFFDTPASAMSNRVSELADFVGQEEADEIGLAVISTPNDSGVGEVLDDWLISRAASRSPADQRIARIHHALLDGPADVPNFAIAAGVSERTLHRLCHQAFGFPPKALLRQKRFLRTLERVRGVLDRPLSGLIDDGYFDQAHFNRDFRQYMGMSPTDYFNSPREIMRRAAMVRRGMNGSGLQGLHPSSQHNFDRPEPAPAPGP